MEEQEQDGPKTETSENNEKKKEEKIEFKKPVLIGRIGKLPKKARSDPEKPAEEKLAEKPKEISTNSDSKSSHTPVTKTVELSGLVPYKEPKWSGLCPDGTNYALEVLKSGMILETIELTMKPYYLFGRLANCDVMLTHPTMSRYHAVLQYKAFAEEGEHPCGWYLYDLGSTHGTFLNKERIKPNHYVRVRVGHQIKFGASTRTFIVLGPDWDSEGESELTVTEIKQKALEMKLNRDKMIKEATEQREREKMEEEKRREEQGIDWGMGEDAEDEPDLSENPYAVTTNEELYLTDPKKTLRGYCEREGHELRYDCEERGVGQFLCRVELPLDDPHGRPVVAEVIHRGKKKDAVVQCALEACRILDRAGLLRQAKHEPKRRKERDWSADDYYDSDEDTFLDRTGSVEKKRKQRMVKLGALEEKERSEKALTYQDLLNQIQDIESRISSEEKTLERLRSTNKPKERQDGDEDALDAFMTSLGSHGRTMAQKAEISKTKSSIQKLKSELSKTQRLAEIARPADLPPLLKKDNTIIKVANSVVYGKRIKLKEDMVRKPKIRKETKQEDEEFVEEVDSDEEMPQSGTSESQTSESIQKSQTSESIQKSQTSENIQTSPTSESLKQQTSKSTERSPKQSSTSESEQQKIPSSKSAQQSETSQNTRQNSEVGSEEKSLKKMYGPMRPPEDYVIPESYFDQETDRDLPEIEEKEME